MSRRSRVLTLGGFGLAAVAAAGIALAAWLVTGSGPAASLSGSLSKGNAPSVSVSAHGDVTVSWSQNTVNGSRLGTLADGGYELTRYADGSTTPVGPGTGCTGSRSGSADPLQCIATDVPVGWWRSRGWS